MLKFYGKQYEFLRSNIFNICLAITSVYYIFSLDRLPILANDSSVFVGLADSIARGLGYGFEGLSGFVPHTKFPFLHSLLMAPFIKLFGINFLILKLLMVVLTISSFVCVFRLISIIEKKQALPVFLFCACSAYLFTYSRNLMSEIPYMFWSALALYFIYRQNTKKKAAIIDYVCSITFILAAYFTRSVGIVLIPAYLISIFDKERNYKSIKKCLGLGLIFAIPVLWWALRNKFNAAPGTYVYTNLLLSDKEGNSLSILQAALGWLKNIYAYVFYGVPGVVSARMFASRTIAGLLISTGFAGGLVLRLLKRRSILELYTALYMLLLFLWPWSQTWAQRFVTPIFPFIIFYILYFIDFLLIKIKLSKMRTILFCLLFVLSCLSNFKSDIRILPHELHQNIISEGEVLSFNSLSKWLYSNIEAGEHVYVVGSALPVYLSSGIKSVLIDTDLPKDEFLAELYQKEVKYIVELNFFINATEPEGYERRIHEFVKGLRTRIVYQDGYNNLIYKVLVNNED